MFCVVLVSYSVCFGSWSYRHARGWFTSAWFNHSRKFVSHCVPGTGAMAWPGATALCISARLRLDAQSAVPHNLTQPSDLTNTLQYAAYASANDIELSVSAPTSNCCLQSGSPSIPLPVGCVLYYGSGLACGGFKLALSNRTSICASARRICWPMSDKQLQVDRFSGSCGRLESEQPWRRPRGRRYWPPTSFDNRFFAKGDVQLVWRLRA